MTDNISQAGSVRAGYRRSRVEPIDPATISAPVKNSPALGTASSPQPPAPQRPASSIASTKEQKEGICKKLMRVVFLLINIFILAIAILMIIMGSTLWIVFRGSGLSILDVAEGAPLALIINGVLLAMFAMWGCEIAMISGRRKTILYLVALVIMFGFSIFTYFSAKRIASSIQDNLNEYWGTFSTTTRSMIQDFGYCCGLNGPIDYPALPCPQGTRKGCSQAFADMQESVVAASNGFLGGNVTAFLVLAGLAAFLGFSGPKEEQDKDHDQV